jgi:glycosyltransferase involved in cell wall biosynthesis
VKQGPLPDAWLWKFENTRLHLNAADSVATPTRAFAEATARTYRLSALPRIIANGSPSVASDSRPPIRALLTAGRLWDEGKDVATLGRAAGLLDAPIFAAGPPASPTGDRVNDEGLQLLGELSGSELREWMARRPIFVSSAVYEPFGLAVLEAAQAGCALLLADIPTFREIWADAAIFAAPRNEIEFARAARKLLEEPETRARYGEAARTHAGLYTASASSQALLAWHHDVLRQRRPHRESAA